MNRFRAAGTTALAAALMSPAAPGQGQTDPVASNVSGVIGVDLYSHYVSYGNDVWNEGEAFSGSGTINPYAELGVDFEAFRLVFGAWADVNDNAESGIGGDLQQLDVYAGVGFDLDKFSVGLTYQEWLTDGVSEEIVDIGLGFDDTGMIAPDFALSPSLIIHNRVAGEGLEEGTIIVGGIEPTFPIYQAQDLNIDLSVPVNVGYVLDDDYFIAGGENGFGYVSVGAGVSVPLAIIPSAYGAWSVGAGVTLYHTEEEVYENPDDTFLVYNLGLSLAF